MRLAPESPDRSALATLATTGGGRFYAAYMVLNLAHTRTSPRWRVRPPGNLDRLNTRALFPGDEHGFPLLRGSATIPDRLIGWNARPREVPAGTAWHCFLDDYRFETAWSRPQQGVARAQTLGVALSPDFSVWIDMPDVMQAWQTYRNRWVGALWEANGCDVIPCVSWAARKSYAWSFRGVPPGSVVAVGTVGILKYRDRWPAFLAGYEAMMGTLVPSAVLCYGRPVPGMSGPVRAYPTRWR